MGGGRGKGVETEDVTGDSRGVVLKRLHEIGFMVSK